MSYNYYSGTSNNSYGNFYRGRPGTSVSGTYMGSSQYRSADQTTSYTSGIGVTSNSDSGAGRTPWSNPATNYSTSSVNYNTTTDYGRSAYQPPAYSSNYSSSSYVAPAAPTYYPSTNYTSYSSGGGGVRHSNYKYLYLLQHLFQCRACGSKSSYSSYKASPSYSWQSSNYGSYRY